VAAPLRARHRRASRCRQRAPCATPQRRRTALLGSLQRQFHCRQFTSQPGYPRPGPQCGGEAAARTQSAGTPRRSGRAPPGRARRSTARRAGGTAVRRGLRQTVSSAPSRYGCGLSARRPSGAGSREAMLAISNPAAGGTSRRAPPRGSRPGHHPQMAAWRLPPPAPREGRPLSAYISRTGSLPGTARRGRACHRPRPSALLRRPGTGRRGLGAHRPGDPTGTHGASPSSGMPARRSASATARITRSDMRSLARSRTAEAAGSPAGRRASASRRASSRRTGSAQPVGGSRENAPGQPPRALQPPAPHPVARPWPPRPLRPGPVPPPAAHPAAARERAPAPRHVPPYGRRIRRWRTLPVFPPDGTAPGSPADASATSCRSAAPSVSRSRSAPHRMGPSRRSTRAVRLLARVAGAKDWKCRQFDGFRRPP
jgi:hypothetical protein